MEKFSIDLRASDKGERKKAVKYLRDKGCSVIKRKLDISCKSFMYLTNHHYSLPSCKDYDFTYGEIQLTKTLLTLPRDWDKLVEIVEGRKPEEDFEKGVWYKSGVDLANYQGDGKGCGFCNGVWNETLNISIKELWRKATSEEIKEHLIEESKKRGFKIGVRFRSAFNSRYFKIGDIDYSYDLAEDVFWVSSAGAVYHKGKWAEIIKDDVPEIYGYRLQAYTETIWCFGCYKFTKEEALSLFEAMRISRAESISVNNHNITLEKLKEIIDYINKNS